MITYKFLGLLALEYRLSLNNLCKLIGLADTEENRLEIYNSIKNTAGGDIELLDRYNYLFFTETLNESVGASKVAYMCALNFLRRYRKADDENKREVYNDLFKTELKFKEIKHKLGYEKLSVEEIVIISKYRIKYALSRERFCENHNISWRNLIRREKEIDSAILKNKLDMLAEFYKSFNCRKKNK